MDGSRSYHQSWKYGTHENLLRNYIFLPITVEIFGSWGSTRLKFISEIGRNIKEKRGNNKNDVKSFHLDRECLNFIFQINLIFMIIFK